MRTPSVARLNASHGLSCWEDRSSSGKLRCATLSLEGTALTKGATATARDASVMHVSVASFGEDVAVVCFLDDSVGDYPRCSLLTIDSDGNVTASSPQTVYSSTTDKSSSYHLVEVAAFDSTSGVVCFRQSSYLRCLVLTITGGSSLSFGSALSADSYSASFLSVATVDNTTVVVAYRNTYAHGKYVRLVRSGADGTSLVTRQSNTYISSSYSGSGSTSTTL